MSRKKTSAKKLNEFIEPENHSRLEIIGKVAFSCFDGEGFFSTRNYKLKREKEGKKAHILDRWFDWEVVIKTLIVIVVVGLVLAREIPNIGEVSKQMTERGSIGYM